MEDSEFVRVFRSQNEGKEYMFTDISFNVPEEDDSESSWSGTAVHESEDDRHDHHLDDQWNGTPWSADVSAATEPPLE